MKSTVTVAIEIGSRDYQEDYYVHMRIDTPELKGWLLAVMDGHSGKSVAELCAKKIEEVFQITDANQAEEALRHLVSELNSQTIGFSDGSTLSVALCLESHHKVSIAVIGDSPVVVLDQAGQIQISPEHNVRSNFKERKAAEQRGGVYESGYLFTQSRAHGLQLSRALGDSNLGAILSREPDIYTIHDPKWVLVASDGVFDPGHRNTDSLLKEVKEYAERHSTAEEIMNWAKSRGLRDNATALVWNLPQK